MYEAADHDDNDFAQEKKEVIWQDWQTDEQKKFLSKAIAAFAEV